MNWSYLFPLVVWMVESTDIDDEAPEFDDIPENMNWNPLLSGCSTPNFPTLNNERAVNKQTKVSRRSEGEDDDQWPWFVFLDMFQLDGGGEITGNMKKCSGSLIHDEWIITSRTCCWEKSYAKFSLGSISDRESKILVVKDGSDDDVCLVQIQSVKYEYVWKPVCLPKQPPTYNSVSWVYSKRWHYGLTIFPHEVMGLNIMDEDYCIQNTIIDAVNYPSEFCAGIPGDEEEGVQDGSDVIGIGTIGQNAFDLNTVAAFGGPLITDVEGEPTLTGIVSWSEGSETSATVFANVFLSLDWINSIVSDPPAISSAGLDICWKTKNINPDLYYTFKLVSHGPYRNDLDCVYELPNDQNCNRFAFRFEDFDVESSEDCSSDYVVVNWVDDLGTSKSTDRICGYHEEVPEWTVVNTTKIDVVFHTNGEHGNFGGFEFTWRSNNCDNKEDISAEIDPIWAVTEVDEEDSNVATTTSKTTSTTTKTTTSKITTSTTTTTSNATSILNSKLNSIYLLIVFIHNIF